MKQQTTTLTCEYRIDGRTRRNILDQIRKLAASYVPEWQFDEENPDIGSVLALLYADQMQENLNRYNTILERYYVELMNMLGISLKPAFPAHSVALIHMVKDTVPGMYLPKGTRLLGGQDDEQDLIFETGYGVYITEASLSSVFMASGRTGKVIPLKGDYPPVVYVEEEEAFVEEPLLEQGMEPEGDMAVPQEPFLLFDFSGNGYGKNALLMYHSHLFDVQENDIFLSLSGGAGLLDGLEAGAYTLSCYTQDGWERITQMHRQGEEVLAFRKKGECKKVGEGEDSYSLIVLEAGETVHENVELEGVGFSSKGEPKAADMVWNGAAELEAERFAPFGETLGLFAEVYIGQQEYFAKPGAKVTIEFQVDYGEKDVLLPRQKEDEDLRIIKRKPKRVFEETAASVYAQEICLEYYNGTGWRRLETERPVKTLFAVAKEGKRRISFICPDDWQEAEAGGYAGRCLRMQLMKADNCYLQPACHHYPIISEMRFSYTYGEDYVAPQKLVSVCGSRKRDLTQLLGRGEHFPAFTRSRYGQTALYLGLDQRPENGPVSILFRLEEEKHFDGCGGLSMSYSTRNGFSPLKLSDHTDGLAHTGTILFLPPADMALRKLEGQEAYWLRIEDPDGSLEKGKKGRPLILGIEINGVEVDNVETQAETEFYMDEAGPDMRFTLNAGNILSLDVWVNETGMWSEAQMRTMLQETPERARADYDFWGRIENFYVKWEEVDSFDTSQPSDRHYLVDRMNNLLCFGDGVHVRIPRITQDVAFKVTVRCCSGEEANLEPGMISGSMGNLMFVDRIYNPIRSYGGMDIESMDNALRRGTDLINSRKRLISVQDYEREVLNFSSGVAQVKAITGYRKDGIQDASCISIVLLMKDYKEGSFSFRYLRPRLKEHLLKECELSVNEERLDVVEPLFVEISVDVWIQVMEADDSFTIRSYLAKVLETYLDPVEGGRWEIGRLPGKAQIELRLNMEKKRALLKRMTVTAAWQDENGRHETDPEAFMGNPFVVVKSGVHRIHVEQK